MGKAGNRHPKGKGVVAGIERSLCPLSGRLCRAPEPVCIFWRRETYPAPTGIRTTDQARGLVLTDYAILAAGKCMEQTW